MANFEFDNHTKGIFCQVNHNSNSASDRHHCFGLPFDYDILAIEVANFDDNLTLFDKKK